MAGCTPRTSGREPVEVVGVSGGENVADGGGLIGIFEESEVGFLGREDAVDASPPCENVMDVGRAGFLLKNLPNIFLAPEGGASGVKRDEFVIECLICCWGIAASFAIDGDPGGERTPNSLLLLCENALPFAPSMLVRVLVDEPETIGASPQTSTGSRTAKPMTSKPRFWNFATLASVPASTTVFVITLCACRL